MLTRIMLVFAALFAFPTSAIAQDLEGRWAFQIDDAIVFLFAIDQTPEGDWRAQWMRPVSFRGNGAVFSQFRGAEVVETQEYTETGDTVELRFPPTREEGSTDILQFALTGANEASMTYAGTELAPFPLVRVPRSATLGPFDDTRLYDRDDAVTQSDYDPADDADEGTADAVEENAPMEEQLADDAEKEGNGSSLSDDFLEGLDDAEPDADADADPGRD